VDKMALDLPASTGLMPVNGTVIKRGYYEN